MRAVAFGFVLLVLASQARAVDTSSVGAQSPLKGDCPENPRACGSAYAQATFEVGPVVVVATLRVEDGNDELEAVAEARPGDPGEIVFKVLDGSGNASNNVTVNVTLRIEAANTTLAWNGSTEETFVYDPQQGPAQREFRFRVPDDAPAGETPIHFALSAGNETKFASIALAVVHPEESRTPGPGLAVLAAAALAAGLRRRPRG